MPHRMVVRCLAALMLIPTFVEAADVPQSVAALWSDFDPRRDPLEVEVVREWREAGGVYRYVRYLVGTFKGRPARMAAFYGFPDGAREKLPAVMHLHGGGQRAFLEEVKTYVDRGYAALSINWGGREMENARPGDPNTDWGAVDPTQRNVPGYFNLLPGGPFLVDHESPKNCNWYLLTIGCRRGLTFLERQPEVDPSRLGVFGHSMGGNLTMYVAGTDDRVRVAAPSVGGQGFRTEPHDMLEGRCQMENIRGDRELFTRTLGFENYAPRIRCPVLHLSATNDFHGWMDDVYRTNERIREQPLRYSFSPHLNHRFTPETAVTRPLWLDQFLKGGTPLPETPASVLRLDGPEGAPTVRVAPDERTLPVVRVDVYYAQDPDPRARFWRQASVERRGRAWEARLPDVDPTLPLYVFADAIHKLAQVEMLPHLPKIDGVCLSTRLHAASPAELRSAGVRGDARPAMLIDDFSRGLNDWYELAAGHPSLRQVWTRKLTDRRWRGPDGATLELELTMPKTNRLTFVLIENEWRTYRGTKRTYVCEREIVGDAQPQTMRLRTTDFRDERGESPAHWREIDQFGICAHYEEQVRGTAPKADVGWNGDLPRFHRLQWRTEP